MVILTPIVLMVVGIAGYMRCLVDMCFFFVAVLVLEAVLSHINITCSAIHGAKPWRDPKISGGSFG